MASIPTPPQPGLAPLTLSPLQPSTAHLLSLGFACCYVGSLYISNRARLKFETNLPARRRTKANQGPNRGQEGEDDTEPEDDEKEEEVQERAKLAHERSRDDPDVIAARLKMASLASVVCVLGVGVVVYVQNGSDSNHLTEVVALAANYLGGLVSLHIFLRRDIRKAHHDLCTMDLHILPNTPLLPRLHLPSTILDNRLFSGTTSDRTSSSPSSSLDLSLPPISRALCSSSEGGAGDIRNGGFVV